MELVKDTQAEEEGQSEDCQEGEGVFFGESEGHGGIVRKVEGKRYKGEVRKGGSETAVLAGGWARRDDFVRWGLSGWVRLFVGEGKRWQGFGPCRATRIGTAFAFVDTDADREGN